MSFATNLKDYMDHINSLNFLFEDHFNCWLFIKSLCIYFYQGLSLAFVYFISFKWLTDFIELPAIFKQNYIAILEGKNILEFGLEREFEKSFFLFLDKSTLNDNPFVTGFMNSFFLALPFSVPHLLSIRAFLINGLPAGICSIAGTVLGQMVFFSLILFGVEYLIVPLLQLDALIIFAGFGLLINVVYKMVHNPDMQVLTFSKKNKLFGLFKINFILAWVEQMCVYSYFGNLTITPASNLLQTNNSGQSFFLSTFFYLFSLLLGSVFWTGFFGFLIVHIRTIVSTKLFVGMPFIAFNKRIHYFSLVTITVFCFNTIPYYGVDYLISSPLGFIYEDRILDPIKPKIGYHTKPNIKTDDSDEYLVGNTLPFDNVNEVNVLLDVGYLKYEQYSLDSESFWKNRYHFQRIDPDANTTAEQIRLFPRTTKVYPIEITQYDTPKLVTSDLFFNLDVKKREKHIETLLTSLFRPDVYLDYKNNLLVPETRIDPDVLASKLAQVHRQFRKKYVANPIYKAFVNLDMHCFLNGEVKSANLTAKDESNLFKRRIILQNYLRSVHNFGTLSKKNKKSYAERVYNQQFKGSLNIVRQFNSIKLNHDLTQVNNNEITTKVLKFDQPKYQFEDESKMFVHEELLLKPYEPVILTDRKTRKPEYHDYDASTCLGLNNTSPLYIGWDGLLRKFLIKTPTLPVQLDAGDTVTSNKPNAIPDYFSFQSWTPVIDQPLTNSAKSALKFPSMDLSAEELSNVKDALEFELTQRKKLNLTKSVTDKLEDKKIKALLSRLPSYDWHWKKIDLEFKFEKYLDLGNALPPKLDGIAWPGINNTSLIQKLKESFVLTE
jgi:hypothetical protein